MRVTDYIKNKTLRKKYNTTPENEEIKLTFVNDKENLVREKLREYNAWYSGDASQILAYYTTDSMLMTYEEPFYYKNKRNYYWSASSGEEDIKRSHSGMPKDIVDTLVGIVGNFDYGVKDDNGEEIPTLKEILENTQFKSKYRGTQLPMTMVEGWGAWRINWDKSVSKYPVAVYYRAENVEFIEKWGIKVGVIFKDFYKDEKKKRDYMIVEIRKKEDGGLTIEQEAYLMNDKEGQSARQVKFEEVPGYEKMATEGGAYINVDSKGTRKMHIKGLDCLLAEPCLFFEDTSGDAPGKSIYAGRLELFDDLDQCISQAANTVRKSTPVEYIDVNYLERDKKGTPVMPKNFDRKFVKFLGARDLDGSPVTREPVFTTQPKLNFQEYTAEAQQIMLYIINGLLSPATLGIDIAKKDNAEAQREKEKITVFTRNWITDIEQDMLKRLFNQLLVAYEFMHSGTVTTQDYNVTVTYPEFADESYENKIRVLGEAFDKGRISPEMYLSKLYGDSLSDEDHNRELSYLQQTLDKKNEPEPPQQMQMDNNIEEIKGV